MGNDQAVATLKALGFSGASAKLVDVIKAGPAAFGAANAAITDHGAVAQAAAQHSQTLGGAMDRVGAILADAGVKIGQKLLPFIENFANGLALVLPGAINIAMGFISALGTVITDIIDVVEAVVGFVQSELPKIALGWSVVSTTVKNVVESMFKVLESIFRTGFNIISGIVRVAVTVISTTWNVVTTVLSIPVKIAVDIIMVTLAIIIAVVQAVVAAVGAVWNAIVAVFRTPVTIAVNLIKADIGFVVTVVGDVISGIIRVWNAVTTVLSGPFKVAVDIISGVIGGLIGIVSGIVGTIGTIFGAMASGISTVFNGLAKPIGAAMNVVVGVVKGIIDGVIGALNSIIDVINGIQVHIHFGPVNMDWSGVNLGHIPKLATGGAAMPYGTYIVGEEGAEILKMGAAGGMVYPNKALREISPVGGAQGKLGTHVDNRIINPQFYGTPKEMLSDMAAMISRNNREIAMNMRQLGAAY
jgi:phage-related protein